MFAINGLRNEFSFSDQYCVQRNLMLHNILGLWYVTIDRPKWDANYTIFNSFPILILILK